MKAQLYAQYTRSCFCERRELPEGPTVAYEPRFEFAKAARQFAKQIGLLNLHISEHKTAQGELPHGCEHGATQWVRIDWQLERPL